MAEHHGLLARFETADALVAAVKAMRQAGYCALEPCTPYPVAGLSEALGFKSRWVPVMALAAALMGAAGIYFMQWYSSVVSYPFVVGGKPLHSWPAFLIPAFVIGLLSAVVGSVVSMLAGNRLPRPYHPAFNVAEFDRVTSDGFFLLVAASDPCFDDSHTAARLHELEAAEIVEVPA